MDKKTIVRLVALGLAILNMVFGIFGWTPIPMDGTAEAIYEVVSIVAMVGTSIWNMWKNNNFTAAAKLVQKILEAIKKGKLSVEIVEKWLEGVLGNDIEKLE